MLIGVYDVFGVMCIGAVTGTALIFQFPGGLDIVACIVELFC